MNLRGTAVMAFLYLILPLVQTLVYILVQPFGDAWDATNFIASIFSYHWLLANVLLSLKLPVLQNGLPYDLRIRLHIWSTLGITVFLVWHALFTIVLKSQVIDVVSWSLVGIFLGLVVLSVLWVPLPGLKKLVLGKAYEFLKSGHKVMFLVLAGVTWWHVADRGMSILDPNRAQIPAASAWAYQGLFALTVVLYLYTLVREFFLPVLTVKDVTRAGGILRLTLAGHPRLKYRSGQFAFLRFLTPGLRKEEHPFSFTTAHSDHTVGFAIRELGDFTRKLTTLHPGDKVRVNAGFGAFHPKISNHPKHNAHPLALIGSGIGVAPLISILKDLGRKDPRREVVCLQAVTKRDELLEPHTVAELTKTMPNLRLKTFVYEEDGVLYTPEVLERELPEPRRYEVFLCSSERVRKLVVDALQHIGIPKRRIVFEAFSLG